VQEKTFLNSVLLHKRRVVEVLMDFVFISIAYYFAYYLRFEDSLLPSNLSLMHASFIWIILIKMSIFFIFGLYRGVWRYVSIADFLTMFKAVSMASITVVLLLTLFFRFQGYSRALFFIDWLLLLFLVIGSRFLFRILGEFFSNLRKGEVAVLIIGAGDTGEMVVREIKKNSEPSYNLVGFIDDDPYKLGSKIQGVPILGARNRIKDLVALKGIKEIIIAIPSLRAEYLFEIEQISRDYGILCRKVKTLQDNLNKSNENR
jgi:UDP-GlcNAc:undecaprenyl-phosphate GlcNAc-1-phosphate transferase